MGMPFEKRPSKAAGLNFESFASPGNPQDWQGNLQPYIYDDSQMVLAIPFWHRCIHIRLIPVKKRFIKEFKTKAGATG